ncbi:MAG: extracellular solute-binding protein [Burkholderiales bacterium]|nr:extracellular solute-binding protein [Anaerolineae bacterium]
MHLRKPILLSLCAAVLLLGVAPSFAQSDGIVLQVAVPEWMQQTFDETLFDQFEAENPGVTVQIPHSGTEAFFPPVYDDLTEHLDAAAEYAASGDLLYIDADSLSVEATRAGYFLDLTPLTSSDPTLNSADFFPAAWQSFQWDGAIWALPVSLDVITLIYDPAAFDAAGVAYPSESWTLDDYANAARALAERDSSGDVTTPGLMLFGNSAAAFVRSLVGEGLYDGSTLPNQPRFTNPNLETFMTTWLELENEGVAATRNFNGQPDTVPMRAMPSFGLGMGMMNPDLPQPQATLLPGGVAGLSVEGFAISKGTAYPEQAYALLKYMTSSPAFATKFFGASPARQSLVGAPPPPDDPDSGGVSVMRVFAPEAQAVVDRALPVAMPTSELRYMGYLLHALDRMGEGLDAHSALQEAEAQAVTNLQTAAETGATSVVFVATPVPAPVLGPGEIALRFGMTSFIMPLPNRDVWDSLMAEFVANDPQVGQIIMDTDFAEAGQYAENYDCFYLPYNAVPTIQLDSILNLDPFMDTDSTFDRNDVVGNLLQQLQRDNKTWAFPISIEPSVLRYNTELFTQAGVPLPENGWTVNAFNDALRALRPTEDGDAPFMPNGPGDYMLMLIAAYGGLPIDYRTTPVTIDFTSQANVDAIRQVLDLAKAGYIEYSEQARMNVMFIGNGDDDKAIYTDSLNGMNVRITRGSGPESNPYQFTTYPRGSQYGALSYGIGTAYISANAQNPDACYRWLSFIGQHPELFSSMPARRSLINDPAVSASQGADTTALYNQIDTMLLDPSTLVFPQPAPNAGALAGFLTQFWLSRAFDNYILHDADLETELADSELIARSFLECTANIPPFDPAAGTEQEQFQPFIDCATSVDSSLGAFFGTIQ